MMEAEGLKSPVAKKGPQPFKPQENKKYRLRPINFGNENNIYKKYFQASVAKWLSWLQLILGMAAIAAKFMHMLLGQQLTWTWAGSALGSWGLGTLAAVVSMTAAYRSSYCRLHSAMALHIVNAVVQYILVEKVLNIEIPQLRNDMALDIRESKMVESDTADILCAHGGRNCTREIYDRLEIRDMENIYGFYRVELILTGMLSIYGILQILLSFVLAIMTGRAICCGRMSLERKFYEIESMGSSDSARVARPMADGNDALPKTAFKRKESEHSDTSLASMCHSPLPYGVSVTPRSSEDLAEAAGGMEQTERPIVLQPPPAYAEKLT